jgi:hypothetical protein
MVAGLFFYLENVAAWSSQTSVHFYQTTRWYSPDEGTFQLYTAVCLFIHLEIVTFFWNIRMQLAVTWLCAAKGKEFESRWRRNFYFMSSRRALGPTQPPIQWVPWAISPGVKRPGREANH